MQAKEELNEDHGEDSTVMDLDPRKPPVLHSVKGSVELPMISTYNETEIKLLVKVTDSDIRPVTVNIEADTVKDLKLKVGVRQLFGEEIGRGMRVRLITRGKIMLDGHKLSLFSES